MPLASLTQFILTLIFGSIELFVQILQSPIGNILATRRRFADEKTPSSDMSTPRKNQFSTSGKRVDRSKSKAALGVVNRCIVSDDDNDKVSTPEPDGLDNIQKIFRLGLDGPYKRAVDHTKHSSTREPAFYDKHLDTDLRPTKVAYCPDIPAQLAEVAERRYEEYKGKLGMPPECEETDFDHIRNTLEGKKVVRSENGILLDYANTMGEAILPITSALAFEIPSWKQRYIEWTTEQKQDKAIPDAGLRVNLGILPPEDNSHDCLRTKITENPSGRKRRQSPVLDDLRCRICDNPYREKLNGVAEHFRQIVLYEFKSLTSGTFEHLTALLEQTCHDDVWWKVCDEGCSHTRLNAPVTGSPTGFDAENPVIRLTARNWEKTDVGRSLGTSQALVKHRNNHGVSAKYMIQQIWSEMVKHDATFLVLNSGNFEIIVLRDRGNRTLYLSDIIVTADPGYFQIHVGLFLAAIQDAMDRAARLNASKAASALPFSWTGYVRHHRVKIPDMVMDPVDIEEVLSNCHKLCLEPAKGTDAVSYRRWNLYERRPKEQFEESHNPTIRTRATDDLNICVGTVELSGKTFENCVIVKTARGKYATHMLSKESSVYRSLSGDPQKGNIGSMYGFFIDLSNEDEPLAVLLLQYLGNPWRSGELSSNQWKSLKRTKDCMRKRRYEFGEIYEKNVVIAPGEDDVRSDVFLVGLSKCIRSSAEKQRSAKRQKIKGTSIHLGPIVNPMSTATQVFQQITAWTKNVQGASIPPTTRCLGWVDLLPDWLEISISGEDAEKFQELWKQRPQAGNTHLRNIVCMVYK